eukprot:10061697-Alexandrium_andersonii.AAC.1
MCIRDRGPRSKGRVAPCTRVAGPAARCSGPFAAGEGDSAWRLGVSRPARWWPRHMHRVVPQTRAADPASRRGSRVPLGAT